MSVFERQGIYMNSIDPYLEVELLGPHLGDTVFYAMRLVLKESYGLAIEQGKYKGRILHNCEEIGDLTYDNEDGHRIPRLRAKMTGRTIVFCYKPTGLVIDTRIHFDPSRTRRQTRAEILPTLRRKENEFLRMLKTKPSDFLKGLEVLAEK